MTCYEFDEKWKDYLEEGHYGLDIDSAAVIEYLDSEFEKEIKVNKDFSFSQLKLKFGMPRIYANSNKTFEWEKKVGNLL